MVEKGSRSHNLNLSPLVPPTYYWLNDLKYIGNSKSKKKEFTFYIK